MNDPVPAIEKRLARSEFVRKNEKHAAWYTYSDWSDSRELKSPGGKLFIIMMFSALLALLVTIFTVGEADSFPAVAFFSIWSGISIPPITYFVLIPLINAARFHIPSQLSDTQRNAVQEFEKMNASDQALLRDALHEFVREPRIDSAPYIRKQHMWSNTMDELDRQHNLEYALEALQPSAAEHTLQLIQERNNEINFQLSENTHD